MPETAGPARRRRGLWQLGGVTVLALLVAMIPSGSHADFEVPFTVSAGSASPASGVVGSAADGRSVFVWSRLSGDGTTATLQARGRTAAGVLGPAKAIATIPSNSSARTAVAADGSAFVVWVDADGRVRGRERAANGALGPVRAVSASRKARAATLALAVDADGDVLVAWCSAAIGELFARPIGRDSGALGPLRRLSAEGIGVLAPAVATRADGAAVVAWSDDDQIVRARRLNPGGVWQQAVRMSPASHEASQPRVGLDADGDAAVLWQRLVGPQVYDLAIRTLELDGDRSAVTTAATGLGVFSGYTLDVRNDGQALATWRATDEGGHVYGRTVSAGGAVSELIDLSGVTSTNEHVVAMNPAGRAVVAWTESTGSGSRIVARTRTATGALSPVDVVSVGAANASVSVDVAATGDAVASWTRYTAGTYRISAAVDP